MIPEPLPSGTVLVLPNDDPRPLTVTRQRKANDFGEALYLVRIPAGRFGGYHQPGGKIVPYTALQFKAMGYCDAQAVVAS